MKNLIAKASAFVLDYQKWFLLGLIILLLALPIFPMPSIVLRIIVMIMIYATLAIGSFSLSM